MATADRVLAVISTATHRLLSDLRLRGWVVDPIHSVQQCVAALAEREYHALLLDRALADGWVEQVLEQVRRRHSRLVVVLRGQAADPQEVMRLARLGLDDFLPEDLAGERVAARLSELLDNRRGEPPGALSAAGTTLIGRSRAMRQVAETVRMIAARRCTVLITGCTGTGKELVARLIHALGPRGAREMVTVNCGAIPEQLLEAEFFGHVRGAFTGAVAARMGRFEQAHGSTIFLDEIGDMPLELQAKVLRAIQEREFQRVGSSQTVQVDVRVVAATNQDLAEKVRQGSFREDLYYRLNVVPIPMPSLAERMEDVPGLVEHFLEKISRLEDLPRKRVTPETLERLMQYDWPGNVRQLENAVEQAVVLSGDREELYASDFPLPAPASRSSPSAMTELDLPAGGLDLDDFLSRVEVNLLHQALERAGGNKNRAAQILHLKRTTLSAKLKNCHAAKV